MSACGSNDQRHEQRNTGVAVVDSLVIDSAAVARRIRAIDRGLPPSSVHLGLAGSPRQQAVGYLIRSNWMIREAALQGLSVSASSIARRVQSRRQAYGGADLQEVEQASGQTLADLQHEAATELAAQAIQQRLEAQASKFTPSEIDAYYRHNRSSFHVPERRITDLAEQLSRAEAATIVRRLGTGARFTAHAVHEPVELAALKESSIEKQKVLKAIFAARPGVPSRPMLLNKMPMVFIVRQIIPAHIEPERAVQKAIFKALRFKRLQALAARYFKSYRERWTASTSCSPGYLVQGCAQYAGPIRPEVDPFLEN